jgi:hypothetical protein
MRKGCNNLFLELVTLTLVTNSAHSERIMKGNYLTNMEDMGNYAPIQRSGGILLCICLLVGP